MSLQSLQNAINNSQSYGIAPEKIELNLNNPIFAVYVDTKNLSRQAGQEYLAQVKHMFDVYSNVTMWIIASDKTSIECVYDGQSRNRNMEISEKYKHIGYSYPAVPVGWKSIVEKAIIDIEKEMWPRWIPMFIKRKIHYLATGNSVVKIKYRFWDKVRKKLTKAQMITDIKDKFAGLRIYGYFGDEIEAIIKKAEDECYRTCERCGGDQKVRTVGKGWLYNLCKSCRYTKYK